MTANTTSRLSGLRFVNPQLGVGQIRVPAAAGAPLPGEPGPLSAQIAGAGRLFSLPEWNAVTHGTSLVVVAAGEVVHEWYAEDVRPGDLLLGASMTKSALAHLVGETVSSGALRLADRVVDHVPELRDTGYRACTVLDVATMTSGVDWVEDHRNPDSAASRLIACFGADRGDSRDLLLRLRSRTTPGSRWEYCTADSQVLDWVRERATGETYDVALGRLWRSLGCTAEATVATDSLGVALAGGGLAAPARDWARVALLQRDGRVGDRAVLDPAWVDRSCTPDRPFLRPGRLPSSITTHAGFGLHWWPLDDAGRRVTADGSRGQFAYADRDLGVVVIKTSQWPYDDFLVDRQLRDLSYLGLPVIARAAASAR